MGASLRGYGDMGWESRYLVCWLIHFTFEVAILCGCITVFQGSDDVEGYIQMMSVS